MLKLHAVMLLDLEHVNDVWNADLLLKIFKFEFLIYATMWNTVNDLHYARENFKEHE